MLQEFLGKPIATQDLASHLPKESFEHLKKIGRLSTISDRLIFREKNSYRPWESVMITKLIEPGFSIEKFLSGLLDCVEKPFLLNIDFHFLILCPDSENEYRNLRFQSGSKASSVNNCVKIMLPEHETVLKKQFQEMSAISLLDDVFIAHSRLFGYIGSGLRPHSLLSVLVHIQKFD